MATRRLSLGSRLQIPVSSVRPTVRYHSAHVTQPRWPPRSRRFLFAGIAGVSAVALVSCPAYLGTFQQHHEETSSLSDEPLLGLFRAYAVYTACAVPPLVDNSPRIFSTVQSIPIVRHIADLIVKCTFFDQFVGGSTARDTFPILEKLRNQGTGTLLVYSVEEREQDGEGGGGGGTPAHKVHIEEVMRLIDAAAEFEARNAAVGLLPGKIWAAVKLTALLPDAGSVERYSRYISNTRAIEFLENIPFPYSPQPKDLHILSARSAPAPLTQEDLESIRDLYRELQAVCSRARDKGVTLVFDAEHSWHATNPCCKLSNAIANRLIVHTRQPAIDAIVLALTREFNRPISPLSTPLVYGTYQSYLRRGVPHLQACIADAKREGYMIGVKLVRGAYQPLELSVYEKQVAKGTWFGGSEPPVWTVKSDTDETYNKSARLLVSSLKNDLLKGDIPVMGVMFGTHNLESTELIMKLLIDAGLATPSTGRDAVDVAGAVKLRLNDKFAGRFTLAQLYGMRDDLTASLANRLSASLPVTMKYVPYGSLDDVIPYLARRAVENKSVLGGDNGAAEERRIVGAKLKRKLLGSLSQVVLRYWDP